MTNAIGDEWDSSKGIESSAGTNEQVTAMVKFDGTSKPKAPGKATETTHIVPIKSTATIGNVIRSQTKTPHSALLKMAQVKVAASFGGRQHQESLIMTSGNGEPAFCWNGGSEATMDEHITTIELDFDSDMRAPEPQQPGCSGRHATQKTSVKFLSFEDKDYVKPEITGSVSTVSMGFTDPLDNEWISLANFDRDLQFSDTGTVFSTTGITTSNHQAIERYRTMNNVSMPCHNLLYVFDQYGGDHLRIIADELPSMQDRHEETLNSLQTIKDDGFLCDSGATSSINIINNDPRSKGKYGAFMLVSKIVKLETASTFTIYGGDVCSLKVLGWSWHRFPMKCSITNEVVVFLQRAFVAIDHTGKYRKIYSPGSLVPFGFIFMQGIPTEVTITGTELTFTLYGPSSEAYIFDPAGHAIKCPPIGKGLVVLSILDSTDSDLSTDIREATDREIMLLIASGAQSQPTWGC